MAWRLQSAKHCGTRTHTLTHTLLRLWCRLQVMRRGETAKGNNALRSAHRSTLFTRHTSGWIILMCVQVGTCLCMHPHARSCRLNATPLSQDAHSTRVWASPLLLSPKGMPCDGPDKRGHCSVHNRHLRHERLRRKSTTRHPLNARVNAHTRTSAGGRLRPKRQCHDLTHRRFDRARDEDGRPRSRCDTRGSDTRFALLAAPITLPLGLRCNMVRLMFSLLSNHEHISL